MDYIIVGGIKVNKIRSDKVGLSFGDDNVNVLKLNAAKNLFT